MLETIYNTCYSILRCNYLFTTHDNIPNNIQYSDISYSYIPTNINDNLKQQDTKDIVIFDEDYDIIDINDI